MRKSSNAIALTALAGILLLTLVAYLPGLQGGFLFDDFGNLTALGSTGPIDNWPAFWRYITSGTADPTGRPLTLLTFLVDARNWPAEPYPFKRTGLILHLINGLLLCGLLLRLGRALQAEPSRARTAALIGTAFWLLHPLLVSTTLYIVQREAMLPATCVLGGLLLWLHGRSQFIAGRMGSGMFWSVIGLGGFTLLGVLSKANGVLLPLYALLMEVIVLAPRQPIPSKKIRRAHRFFVGIFAFVPAIGIGCYLLWTGIQGVLLGGNAGARPWSYAQRLITEPRVLVDYLTLLWLPRPFSSGLFNDQYVASTSLLQPISTLAAIAAIAVLIGVAWRCRRRHSALALAILFYFAGQVLESTSIPLELYFEHRNYVPALLLFWPLGLWLADTRTLPVIKRGLMCLMIGGLALMTYARATVWGNEQIQALVWARINMDSPRAQANAAQIEMQQGHPQNAILRLRALLATQTDQTQIAFNLIGASCMTGGVSARDMAAATQAMKTSAITGSLFAHWFERTLPVAAQGSCPGLTLDSLLGLINAGLENPKLNAEGTQQDLIYLRGRIALAQRHPDAALADFIRALDLEVRPGMALQAAATLGTAGYPRYGLTLLDHYSEVSAKVQRPGFGMPMLHEWVLGRQNYWPKETAHLRHQLSLDVNAANTNTASPTTSQSTSS